MPSFINQLAKTPSRVPSSAYGYTAGAFYAGDHGTPASLTLGGYDTARFKPHDRAFKLSYKRSDPTPALTVQSNVATTRYDQENPKALAPVIRVQRIEATTSYQDKLMNFTLSDTNDSFVATIDPATPFLHLPRTVCDQFESYLNLTWDPDLQIYRFRDDVAFQHLQQDSSPLFQFSISGQDGSARLTNISISAKAFALTMGPPSDAQRHSRSQYSDRIPYFPLRRGNDSADFIIGRAFMQEAYLITNYDLGLFSIYQALFPVNSSTNHSIVNIDSTWDFSQFQSSEQKQAIALLGVFLVAWILIVLVVTVLALAGAVLATGSVPAEQQRSSQQAQDGDVERGFDSYESIHLLRSSDIDELSLNGDQASLRPISTERSDDWTQDHTQRHELGVATIQEPEDSPRQTANDNTSKQRQVSGGRPRIAEGRTLGRSLGVSIPEPNIQHTTKDTVYNASSRSDTEGVETSEFDTTSTTSTSDTSISSPTLEAFEKRAVDTLMIELRSLLSHGAHIGIAIRAGGREFQPEHDSKGISSTASSVTASSFQMDNNNKHYRDENGQADHTDQGYGRRDSAKRSRVGSPQYEADSRRFACPFYRRNPKKHLKHRSCAGPGWPSVHRVKEHLYRNHALPIHCNRCGLTMETDGQLRSHQRQAEGCKVCLIDLPEGFDKEQEKELRKRKPGETEEERWYGVYKVLFPDEDGDLVPSPC
ncbi:hypothetical protein B0T17DRAFT_89192 [Bombardia bombarda]|uniref:C2H2-type domain-containing protein n=1 Tax=Bombardia bombarda TaxID=252184 RepID=A0AA39XNA8_9PEZI|nr:hypothetical protein B0T17DRAFT_89192 [Bombardia bombarda]